MAFLGPFCYNLSTNRETLERGPLDNVNEVENLETIHTDALVIGGGAASCMAAISARNNGANVLMLDKRQIREFT